MCCDLRSSADQAFVARGVILMVAERARAPIIDSRYGLLRYFARYASPQRAYADANGMAEIVATAKSGLLVNNCN
jgi:hypothetical protein